MEKLNLLGSSLPPERPPTDQAIESLSGELSQEFKIAANAVTKLYRVANERNSLLKHRGYLHCIEDLLALMREEPALSVEDIHLWCLRQRGELLPSHQNTGNNTDQGKNSGSPRYDFHFDNSTTKSSGSEVPHFRLSTPPLSVEHTNVQSKSKKTRWNVKKHQNWKNNNHTTKETDYSSISSPEQDINDRQRRAIAHPGSTKKQKVVTTTHPSTRRVE